MMQLPVIILKSRGNWWDNTLMLNRDELRELGLDDVNINPFHINPRTKTHFDPSRFTVKHGYDGLVDAMAKNIMREDRSIDVGRAKMQARRDLNEATKRFNDKKGAGDPHRLPMPYHKSGKPGLDPRYKLTHYSEEYQKHARHSPGHPDDGMDTFVAPGRGGKRTHPRDRKTHVHDEHTGKLVLATRALSNVPDADTGENIEGDELHPYAELKQIIELERPYAFPDYETRGGIINGEVMMEDHGEGTRGWRRYHKNQNPLDATHGGGTSPDHKLHRGLDGRGYDMLRAIMSLHPRFFEKGSYHEKTVLDRQEYLREIFEDSPAGMAPVLDELAWTPVGELLTEPFRGGRVGRSQRGVFKRILAEVKTLVGIPDEASAHEKGPDSEEWAQWRSFHDNADNLHLQMNEWQKAYPSLSKALYASILARRQGGVLPSQIQSDMAAYLPHISPINPAEIKDIPFNPGGGAQFREMSQEPSERPQFASGGGVTPGSQVSALGSGMPVGRDSQDMLLSTDAIDDAWLFIKGVCC